jgi:uncharacterized protein YjdB
MAEWKPPIFEEKLDNIALTAPSTSVAIGATLQMSATPRDAPANPIPNLPPPAFVSSDATRASVDPGSGVVTGVGEGQATNTATVVSPEDGPKRGSLLISVTGASRR